MPSLFRAKRKTSKELREYIYLAILQTTKKTWFILAEAMQNRMVQFILLNFSTDDWDNINCTRVKLERA